VGWAVTLNTLMKRRQYVNKAIRDGVNQENNTNSGVGQGKKPIARNPYPKFQEREST